MPRDQDGSLAHPLLTQCDPTFLERFQVVKVLGSGTFGAVFRAQDRELKRAVVIKILRPEHAGDPTLLARFRREAEAMARLAHPRVVSLLDHGCSGECHYLIAPDEGGTSLEHELGAEGALPLEPGPATAILTEVLEGLEAIHAAGLVHRDLKPANVLRLADGHLALIDLGLAGVAGAGGTLTATGQVVGTPAYLAPEQIRGQPPGTACDLYALGVLAYELLTGRNPFDAPTMGQVIQNHLTLDPDPPHRRNGRVPRPLSAWVMDLLEKDPTDRPASARAALAGLREATSAAAREPTQPRPDAPLPAEPLTRPASPRRPSRGPALALALASVGLLTLAASWGIRPAAAPPQATPRGPAPDLAPELPAELAALATRELEQAHDSQVGGAPLLASDPALWGRNLQHLTVPSRFYAWLGSGGRPEDLSDDTREVLRSADAAFRALGYPAPFAPFLAGPGDAEEHFEPADWADLPEYVPPLEAQAGPMRGWLAEAYREARGLERRRIALADELRRALVKGDTGAGPDGFLAQWRLMTMARVQPIPERILGALFRIYVGAPTNRVAYVDWVGDGLEGFRRLSYCLARAVRDQPEDADRAALLYLSWILRLRAFVRGPSSHAPPEFVLGFVPPGPAGAHLAAVLFSEACETRIEMPDEIDREPLRAYWRRALAPTGKTPAARQRLARAIQGAILAAGSVGQTTFAVLDIEDLGRLVLRGLEFGPDVALGGPANAATAAYTAYERLLRVAAGTDRARALRDMAALAPRLVAARPDLEERLRTLLAAEAP